mmetsp:Transcript_3241/g.7117  ORF Transcript_3241/g.7117 Transcript_3241/m.7117 type:complete len:504 (+) Transcript_3241:125-1636(+)|eukprot:CAMPEP_0201116582 /NCGR_PEP_ID=MMETSP0850-20130426/808_1 /ASSEMBLY_ACC=CAM_ASM_000622 /TAXON_ID=183588 /ORGANISM="Pseudo-nitzschia fraudulenta, Strain WWA7" /LENGTH=503 /DNA_ID=CAMNT_0047380689 /DNA_START=195 /DNA_END=1706 /DNA_ORIENTATION=-
MANETSTTEATESKPLLGNKETQKDVEAGNDGNKVIATKASETILEDVIETLTLAFPIFITSLSWVGKKTTDTGLLGHLSKEALAASALSDLWTMTTQVLLSGRVLGVLIGGAVGAGNNKLAGIYLQVSYVVLFATSIIVFFAWNMTEQVWLWFGSDPEISRMAGFYAKALSFAIPGTVAFGQLSQYFSAQKIMHPDVYSATVGLAANLLFGLIFVLGWPIPGFDGYGFEACPIVTSVVTYIQLAFMVIVYVYIQKLHETCWPGFDPSEITWARIKTFSELYFPAALSTSSDFWRVAVIGSIAASLGETQVAVFNTAYRIMWIALVFVISIAAASSINMSMRLGKMDPYGAKQAGYVSIGMAFVMLFFLGFLILVRNRWFGLIFTSDEEFLALFAECSVPFTIALVFMNLAVVIERIPYTMGRTKEVFVMGFIASWGGQVPAVWVCTQYWRDDLVGLYTGMAFGYFVLTILYSVIVLRSDWVKYAKLAQERSESTAKKSSEEQ